MDLLNLLWPASVRHRISRHPIGRLHEGHSSYGKGLERRVDSFGRADVLPKPLALAPLRTEVVPHVGGLHADGARHDRAREGV